MTVIPYRTLIRNSPGRLAYWRMGERSGTRVRDIKFHIGKCPLVYKFRGNHLKYHILSLNNIGIAFI